jgi:hypothetical protein
MVQNNISNVQTAKERTVQILERLDIISRHLPQRIPALRLLAPTASAQWGTQRGCLGAAAALLKGSMPDRLSCEMSDRADGR